MKTTIEIADGLLALARQVAKRRKTTLRALTEEGLRLVLSEGQSGSGKKLPPSVTFRGSGPTSAFEDGNWGKLRDEIYRGRGS